MTILLFDKITVTRLEPQQFFYFVEYPNKYGCWRRQKFRPKWAVAGKLVDLWPKIFCQICTDTWWTNAENFKKISWFLFEFKAKWSRICCNNKPTFGKHQQQLPRVGLLLQQIFSYFAITQTRIMMYSWNFQHLFII